MNYLEEKTILLRLVIKLIFELIIIYMSLPPIILMKIQYLARMIKPVMMIFTCAVRSMHAEFDTRTSIGNMVYVQFATPSLIS